MPFNISRTVAVNTLRIVGDHKNILTGKNGVERG